VVEGFTITGAPVGQRGAFAGDAGKITFRNCVFRDMDAGPSTGAGAALNGDADIIDCEFVNCIANSGGGLYHSGGHLYMSGTTIRECGNKGAYLNGQAGDLQSALIEDCVFLDNWSDNAGAGLHISLYDAGATVRRCRFEGNMAYGGSGGGLAWGNFGPKLVEDCLFVRNSSPEFGRAGGLAIGGNGSIVVRGNTFHENSQTNEFWGGATLLVNGWTTFERNIISGSSGNTAVFVDETQGGHLTSSCNVYWANEDGIGVPLSETDREVDPQFCDPEDDDFTVHETSPSVEPGSLGCGQIGAFGVGCGTVSVERESWGKIKGLHR
jgi:hypothetical protein